MTNLIPLSALLLYLSRIPMQSTVSLYTPTSHHLLRPLPSRNRHSSPSWIQFWPNSMGLCLSGGDTGRQCTDMTTTAKLVLQDGSLQEFSYPIKAADVLHRYDLSSTCFICNSDDMDFEDAVSAVGADEPLHPGQLYFALPLNWLKRPLQAQEMAALAVKASTALMKTGKYVSLGNLVCPLIFSDDTEVSSNSLDQDVGCARKSRFSSMLTSIPE